jgi:hypothetical protein
MSWDYPNRTLRAPNRPPIGKLTTVKLVLALGIAAVAIAYFSHRASMAFDHQGKKAAGSISNVNTLLERASSGKPVDGRPAPDKRWVARMTDACVARESLLARVPTSGTVAAIAARGTRILAIERAYAARVELLRPPSGYRAEYRAIRDFNREQQRLVQRVVAAAGDGDLGRATRESVALRELAGRANTVFLGLGLDRCVFGSSGMPL